MLHTSCILPAEGRTLFSHATGFVVRVSYTHPLHTHTPTAHTHPPAHTHTHHIHTKYTHPHCAHTHTTYTHTKYTHTHCTHTHTTYTHTHYIHTHTLHRHSTYTYTHTPSHIHTHHRTRRRTRGKPGDWLTGSYPPPYQLRYHCHRDRISRHSPRGLTSRLVDED